jgi:hypothetical protein
MNEIKYAPLFENASPSPLFTASDRNVTVIINEELVGEYDFNTLLGLAEFSLDANNLDQIDTDRYAFVSYYLNHVPISWFDFCWDGNDCVGVDA